MYLKTIPLLDFWVVRNSHKTSRFLHKFHVFIWLRKLTQGKMSLLDNKDRSSKSSRKPMLLDLLGKDNNLIKYSSKDNQSSNLYKIQIIINQNWNKHPTQFLLLVSWDKKSQSQKTKQNKTMFSILSAHNLKKNRHLNQNSPQLSTFLVESNWKNPNQPNPLSKLFLPNNSNNQQKDLIFSL